MADVQPVFVVLDVETTGLNPQTDEVLEIAAQRCQGKAVLAEYETLIKPNMIVPKEVIAVHGLTNELLAAEGKDPSKVFAEFREFVGDAIIVAHNAPFDVSFLNESFKRYKVAQFDNRIIDTIEIAKKYLILASYKLSNVAAYLKVPQVSAHRSLVDVITTREVFFKLIDRAKGK